MAFRIPSIRKDGVINATYVLWCLHVQSRFFALELYLLLALLYTCVMWYIIFLVYLQICLLHGASAWDYAQSRILCMHGSSIAPGVHCMPKYTASLCQCMPGSGSPHNVLHLSNVMHNEKKKSLICKCQNYFEKTKNCLQRKGRTILIKTNQN